MKLTLLYIFLGLVLISCKKEIPALPEENSPIFKAEGILDGEDFSITAGIDGAYMHTNSLTINGVDAKEGIIQGNSSSFKLLVFDGNHDVISEGFEINEGDQIKFNSNPPTFLATLDKSNLSNSSLIESVKWYADGIFIGTNLAYITEPGIYNIKAEVEFTNGSTAQVSNELIIGYRKNANASIKHIISPNGGVICWMDNPLHNLERVEWRVNGELLSETKQLQLDSIYSDWTNIEATCYFFNNVTRTKNITIKPSSPGMYIEDFTPIEEQVNFNQDYKSEIEIELNGNLYTTVDADNQNNTINIESIDYHGVNNDDEPIVKTRANITCSLLNNTSGETIEADFSIVIGMNAPQ